MRYLTIMILLILSLLLVACGGSATPEPTVVEDDPATEEPSESTDETANEEDEVDTAPESIGEGGEYVAEGSNGSTLTLQYPDEWLVTGDPDDGVIVSTSPDANLTDEAFPSGEATMNVLVMPTEILDAMEIESGEAAFDVLTRFLDFMGNAEGERPMPELGEIQERMMADGNGAYATGSSEQMDMITVIMPMGDFYALISGITAPGELADFEETFFTIAESIIYQAGE